MVHIVYNTKREIHNKWPAMIVQGDSVSPEQAAEIIFKTDRHFPNFTYAGNDTDYRDLLHEALGVETKVNEREPSFYTKIDSFTSRCGVLTGIDYLANDQILSAYVGGPHGWCHWDGTIFSNSYNIGKWPCVESVAEEWRHILENFPYLNLQCQLFDGEACEEDIKPIVTIFVGNGVVRVEDADEPIGEVNSDMGDMLANLFSHGRERGLPIHQIKEKLRMVYGTIPQMEK